MPDQGSDESSGRSLGVLMTEHAGWPVWATTSKVVIQTLPPPVCSDFPAAP